MVKFSLSQFRSWCAIIYLWEFWVCLIETLFIIYLLYKKVGPKSNSKKRIYISIVIMTGSLSALTFLSPSAVLRMVLTGAISVLVALWAFDGVKKGNRYKAVLWPISYLVIVAAADSIAFSIAKIMTDYPLEELMVFSSTRFQFTIIYLLIVAILVWAIAHFGKPDPEFPWQVSAILFVLLSIGIFAAESIVDITLVLATDPLTAGQAKTLSALSYCILLMIFALLVTFEWLGIILKRNKELKQQHQLAIIEQQQYQLMVSASESLAQWKHDYQGQLRLIASLIEQEKYTELKQFSGSLDSALPASACLISSGNRTADAVISLRMMDAKRQNIRFDTKLFLPDRIPLNDVVFASLIGNILDNALDACRKVAPETAEICFEIKPWNQMLYMFCSNTSDGNYQSEKNGGLLSTKKAEGHGIGIRRIRQIVEQAGGTCQFTPKENQFSVSIMIPLEENIK